VLISRLKQHTQMSCGALVLDHPSIDALAPVMLEHLALAETVGGSTTSGAKHEPRSNEEPTAVGYSLDIEPAIFEFHEKAWPHRAAHLVPARWRWMYVDSARRLGQEPLVWLHRAAGSIVGHMGSIPVDVKLGPEVRRTAWLVETMVLEAYRSQAIGSRVMVESQSDMPFALSLGQTAEMREIQLRLGWHQVAPLQVAQLLIRPEHVLKGKLPAPATWAVGLALRAANKMRELRRPSSRLDTRVLARFEARHDRLWDTAARDLTCAVVRDASYLNWKYVDQPGQDFLRLEFGDGHDVKAVAVWMFREPGGGYKYRRAFLVDLVAPLSDEVLLLQVLQGACAAAAARGADSLLCMHTDARLTRALTTFGFRLRQPQRVLLVDPGPLEGAERERALSPDTWFVTQGDSDIDRPW
jgi:hypothetical protein